MHSHENHLRYSVAIIHKVPTVKVKNEKKNQKKKKKKKRSQDGKGYYFLLRTSFEFVKTMTFTISNKNIANNAWEVPDFVFA